MPNVRDHDASVYLRLQGDALSVGGYEANPIFWEEVRNRAQEVVWGVSQHEEDFFQKAHPLEASSSGAHLRNGRSLGPRRVSLIFL